MVSMDGTVITPRRLRRIAIAGALALTVAFGAGATPVTAHDDIKSSTPTSRSTHHQSLRLRQLCLAFIESQKIGGLELNCRRNEECNWWGQAF